MKTALYIAALLSLYAAVDAHDEFVMREIEVQEFAERQQRIEAIRAMDCGMSPVYLAQGPDSGE